MLGPLPGIQLWGFFLGDAQAHGAELIAQLLWFTFLRQCFAANFAEALAGGLIPRDGAGTGQRL
jgi:hypothetical protein